MSEIETQGGGDHPVHTPEETQAHMHAHTAFMVIVDQTGKAFAVTEPPPGVVVDVMPDVRAIKAACIEIADDIQARNAALYVESALQALVPKAPEAPADAVVRAFGKRKKKDK